MILTFIQNVLKKSEQFWQIGATIAKFGNKHKTTVEYNISCFNGLVQSVFIRHTGNLKDHNISSDFHCHISQLITELFYSHPCLEHSCVVIQVLDLNRSKM